MDVAEAVNWYRKAADQGLAQAQCKLGECYYSGWGVEKDEAEAVNWYRKAADQGLAEAQYKLGRCYYSGRGVEEDMKEAVVCSRIRCPLSKVADTIRKTMYASAFRIQGA